MDTLNLACASARLRPGEQRREERVQFIVRAEMAQHTPDQVEHHVLVGPERGVLFGEQAEGFVGGAAVFFEEFRARDLGERFAGGEVALAFEALATAADVL